MKVLVYISLTLSVKGKHHQWFGYKGGLDGVPAYLRALGYDQADTTRQQSDYVHTGTFRRGDVVGEWEAMGLPQ